MYQRRDLQHRRRRRSLCRRYLRLGPSSKTTPRDLSCAASDFLSTYRIEGFCESPFFRPMQASAATRAMDAWTTCVSPLLRATELRKLTDKKARQQKHKAVVDLLKGLHESGLSFHVSTIDRRQSSMGDLFVSVTEPTLR